MNLFYNFELDRILKEIKRRGAKRILIQIPDGLKPQAFTLATTIEKHSKTEVIISASPCYGGCDIAINQARILNVDLIIHYGHTLFRSELEIPTIFLPTKSFLDLNSVLKKSENKLIGNDIGIATTIQHIDELAIVEKYLKNLGLNPIIAPKEGHSTYSGQIIGCDYTPLKKISDYVDCFLIIGSKFHSLGACLAVNKPIIQADPYTNEVINLKDIKKSLIVSRYTAIEKAKKSNNFAILLSTKVGQYDPKTAEMLKIEISRKEKNVTMISADEISPDSLINFQEVDIFINTACPRLAIDDATKFNHSILLPKEILVALGKLEWENLLDIGIL
ncbi:diphthamide biosynthesis enzyme Dph2 [[Eubacterium] cellulosolvens]